MDLTDKQKRFCEEYVIDFNGLQAAIRAGYAKNSAAGQASELLTKPNISSYVKQLQSKLGEACSVSAQDIIEELKKIAFSDINNLLSAGNTIKDITTLENRISAAVSSIKVTEKPDGTQNVELKLHDKLSGIDKLARHIGLYEKDNKQLATEKRSAFIKLADGTEIEL